MQQTSSIVALAVISLLGPGLASAGTAPDCHVGAYRLSDGNVIDLATPADGGELRYRQFDGATPSAHTYRL